MPLAKLARLNDFSSEDDKPLSKLKGHSTLAGNDLSEEDLTMLLDTPMWVDIPFHKPDVTFKSDVEMPPENQKEPVQYFREFSISRND